MRLIDIITYFSKYLASLIYFPTNWILITMWLSMEAVLFRHWPLFRLSCVPKSCQHSIQFLCLTMKLIDSIPYFSKYLASLIYFPTNWILITFWLSMDAVIVSSVSVIFDYHVSKILLTFYTIFVSHNEDLR